MEISVHEYAGYYCSSLAGRQDDELTALPTKQGHASFLFVGFFVDKLKKNKISHEPTRGGDRRHPRQLLTQALGGEDVSLP